MEDSSKGGQEVYISRTLNTAAQAAGLIVARRDKYEFDRGS